MVDLMQEKPDYILFISVHHTATWFLAQNMASVSGTKVYQLSNIDMCFIDKKERSHLSLLPKGSCLHDHFPRAPHYVHARQCMKMASPLDKYRETSVQNVKNIYRYLSSKGKCSLVFSVRDILSSIITRRMREPGETYEYIVDGFVLMATAFSELNPIFFCVDAEKEKDKKIKRFINFFSELGVIDLDLDKLVWDKINITKGQNMLKIAQKKKDVNWIKDTLKWDWEYLMKYRYILQPFFEAHGYQNLLWFK